MASFVLFLALVIFVSLFVSPAISSRHPSGIKAWCAQTPYPKPCEYFLSHSPNKYGGNFPIKGKPDFLKKSLDLALDRAMHATTNTYTLGSKCRNEKEKVAWADCLELYEYTILKINKTVDPYTECSTVDAQTWLSTALTNLETCRQGFEELGVSDYVMPLMSNNVSYLISNVLALNKDYSSANFDKSTYYKQGFPSWVPPGDRKLLQSSAPNKPNVVVAQDGSGNFKTVGEAVAAAAKRSGSGRYVIYVKAGIYNENVEIGNKLKNIMLLGDGIGKTIITGSRSVDGGSTTFRSATVGKYINYFLK